MRERYGFADPAAHFPTAHARHHDVEHYKIGKMFERQRERFVPIHGFDDFVSNGSQMTCNHRAGARFIVCNEYACSAQIDHDVRLPEVAGPIWSVLTCCGQAGLQGSRLILMERGRRGLGANMGARARVPPGVPAIQTEIGTGNRKNRLSGRQTGLGFLRGGPVADGPGQRREWRSGRPVHWQGYRQSWCGRRYGNRIDCGRLLWREVGSSRSGSQG